MAAKRVLITGASKGIGRAVADRLAASGDIPVGLARTRPDDFPGEFYEVDLTDRRAQEWRILMSYTVLPNVFAPEDIVWHETNLGKNFWISDELVGADYSTLFSAQLTKFGPAADPRRITTITTTRSTF